jgi:hypothetical protein
MSALRLKSDRFFDRPVCSSIARSALSHISRKTRDSIETIKKAELLFLALRTYGAASFPAGFRAQYNKSP